MKSLALTTVLVLSASVANAAFNVSNVALATRRVWCRAQVAQCPALCADNQKTAITNECFPDNLFYACVCSDGLQPNVTQ
ncbi:hypothetical protein BZA77DRAFT_324769 [Pyronema omphalodes]|nr:hypothetical protein BZA77DRAFT_324769 [Pyronema omphalodes]